MFRTRRLCLAGALGMLTASAAAAGGDEPATDQAPPEAAPTAAPSELPPHLRAIQRNMGGSILQQFDAFQPESTPWWKQFDHTPQATVTDSPAWTTAQAPSGAAEQSPPGEWPNWGSTRTASVVPVTANAPAHVAPPAVAALRATAAELDEAANRLEELELYRQSDSLREVAQRLRVDARRIATAGAARFDAPPLLAPSDPIDATSPPLRRGELTTAEPTLAVPALVPDPTPMPSLAEPEPESEPATPTASLQPTPDVWNPPAAEAPADRAH